MNTTVVYIIVVLGTLFAILSEYTAVCDVDPSDTASILLEQLKNQNAQLKLDEKIIQQQQDMIELQKQQLSILQDLNNRPTSDSAGTTIMISVSCTALGFVAVLFLRRLIKWLHLRYNIRPEMPQTPPSELMDFAHSYQMDDLERMRSVHVKSPASVYFSGESGDEN